MVVLIELVTGYIVGEKRMNYAIETNGLLKFYGGVRAVDAVDLRVK